MLLLVVETQVSWPVRKAGASDKQQLKIRDLVLGHERITKEVLLLGGGSFYSHHPLSDCVLYCGLLSLHLEPDSFIP
jgi:hypothetical protein